MVKVSPSGILSLAEKLNKRVGGEEGVLGVVQPDSFGEFFAVQAVLTTLLVASNMHVLRSHGGFPFLGNIDCVSGLRRRPLCPRTRDRARRTQRCRTVVTYANNVPVPQLMKSEGGSQHPGKASIKQKQNVF